MDDCLKITYNSDYPDKPTLMVSRKDKTDLTMVNTFEGDVAFGVYCLLTGAATMKYKKISDEIMFQLKCIKEHLKFVSQTIDKSVDFDIEVLDNCISQLEHELT